MSNHTFRHDGDKPRAPGWGLGVLLSDADGSAGSDISVADWTRMSRQLREDRLAQRNSH
jgi:hypothetical protein